MSNVVELRPPPASMMDRDDVIRGIRHLEDISRICAEMGIVGSPAHGVAVEYKIRAALADFAYSRGKEAKKKRAAWRTVTRILESGGGTKLFVRAYGKRLFQIVSALIRPESYGSVAAYPLLAGEREQLEEAVVAMLAHKASLAQAQKRAADDKIRASLQRESDRRNAAAADAQRKRQAAHAKAAEIVALRGVKRFEAVVALKGSHHPIDRIAINEISQAIVKAAVEWHAEKQRKATEAAERKRQSLAKKALKARMPKSKYVAIARSEAGFGVIFTPTEEMRCGSATRASDFCFIVRSILSRASQGSVTMTGERVSAMVALENLEKLREVVADIDKAITAKFGAHFSPRMIEEALGITTSVRHKWTENGRLRVAGKGKFRKWGQTLEYALYSAAFVMDLKAHPERIAEWRAADAGATARRRSEGAKRAVKTRQENEVIRAAERRDIDTMAREIAVAVGDLVAAPLVRLAIMTTMCSRWAKERQEKRDQGGKDEWYDLKDRALRIIARQPWTTISFARASTPRIDVQFCSYHLSEFRSDRREYECTSIEWAQDNQKELQSCPRCKVTVDHDYYSLFDICLALGDAKFQWHVPYSTGSEWLPEAKSLPQVTRARDFDGDTMYRYGRPVDDQEMVVWPPKRLKKEIEALMLVFEKEELGAETQAAKDAPTEAIDLAATAAVG